MADVYLSPSVRHFNRGYGTYGTEEERMNLIADIIELTLTRSGLLTARNNPEYDLTAVVADANAKGADVYVALRSIPCEYGTRGARVYYYREGSNGQRLAEDIYSELSAVTPVVDRGVEDGSGAFGGLGYYELRRTRAPAVIVEIGCHSDPQDADFIITHTYEIGVAIAKGILSYFGVPYEEASPEEQQRLQDEYNSIYFE